VVNHNVEHEEHISLVQSRAQIFEILRRAKMLIDGVKVIRPMTGTWSSILLDCTAGCLPMISSTVRAHAFDVGKDWGYPNRVEAHLLDVI
jgi:hypothetical protein